MLEKEVYEFIKKENLFSDKDKILLAISGGKDSVALFHIFKTLNIKFAVAHCNFKLRGKDSDKDEAFVKELSGKYNIKLYLKHFDTKKYAEENKLSTEDAARKLRYAWFEEIRTKNNFDYIATAHHLNDKIETFFINLIKGTGIKGLRSILPKNNKIVRPLLFAKNEDIIKYCEKNKIKYRTDKSNFDTYFLRNKLRHNIIPVFKEINPEFEKSMSKNFGIYSEFEKIYLQYIKNEKKAITKTENNLLFIDIKKLLSATAPMSVLYEIIRQYNFKSAQGEHILNNINNLQSGKIFYSETHRLLKDRNFLIIDKINNEKQDEIFLIDKNTRTTNSPLKLSFRYLKEIPENFKTDRFTIYVDTDKLDYPLKIRKIKNGDYFFPFGMKNKKLLSDFLTDEKINLFEKEKIRLLTTSDDKIIWVAGYRADNRFKITPETKNISEIKLYS